MKRFRGTGSRQRGRSVGTADTVSCTAKHRQPPPNGAQQQGDAARPWILQECLQCFKLHPQSSSSDSLEFKIFEPMPIIVAFQTSKLSIFRVWFESHAVHSFDMNQLSWIFCRARCLLYKRKTIVLWFLRSASCCRELERVRVESASTEHAPKMHQKCTKDVPAARTRLSLRRRCVVVAASSWCCASSSKPS